MRSTLVYAVTVVASLLGCSTAGLAQPWSPSPPIGTGYAGASKGEITFTWQSCTKLSQKWLTANRASGDRDTRSYQTYPDTLEAQWPRWKASDGIFLGSDKGTQVLWMAPGQRKDVEFQLYEEDDPPAVNEGSRDDIGVQNYGQLQDDKTVRVAEVAAEIIVRNQQDQETTNADPAPNSRGKLGLWHTKLADKENWPEFCTNPTQGSIYNGTSYFRVSAGHPHAAGTLLRTELIGHITDRGGLPDSTINDNGRWRITQMTWGTTVHKDAKGKIIAYYKNVPDWALDGYFTNDTSDGAFDLPNNYMYGGDPPGVADVSEGEDGDTVVDDSHYKTYIEFCFSMTGWDRVSGEVVWHEGCELKKQGGTWIIIKGAAP